MLASALPYRVCGSSATDLGFVFWVSIGGEVLVLAISPEKKLLRLAALNYSVTQNEFAV